jgi:signal transduction histidine kinase
MTVGPDCAALDPAEPLGRSLMRTRNWSIRSKIVALVAVPLTALLALWIFATTLTAGPALHLLSAQTLLDTVSNPGEVLVGELQKERRLSVEFLSAPDSPADRLATQRAATDRAATDFRQAAAGNDAQRAASATLRARIRQVFADLDGLPDNRRHVDARAMDPVGAEGLYNTLIDAGFEMFSATASFGDESVDRQIRAITTIGRGQEYLSRADSLVAGANTAGQLTDDVRAELIGVTGTASFLLAEGVADLPASDRTAFQQFSNGGTFTRLRTLQARLVRDSRGGQPSPVAVADWQPAYDTSAQELRAFEINATASLAHRATPVAVNVLVRLGLAGIVGLIALIVSIVVSVRVGRSIVGRLIRLRGEALEMAGERLPTVVRRLQRGEAVDVDVETPPLEYGRDEIGQLGHAFNEVQRTAVQSAVEEASVRRGINEVFLNIARRSQTLLHRQLALLDRMERRETEPDELEDLYRVDHLATRMRRHAEDLVILAGAAPGRGWRNPVPVIDVIRGAISEVEDYKRVDVRGVESSAIVGRAVGDVIHLLAELLENAASFSPPHTRVQVAGQVLPNGYAMEIEDRGLGMSPEAIEEANRKLLEPPDFDPKDSARLGLFVVAQLANRHGIRVSLRPSAFGGVTAIVLLPAELVTAGTGPMALPAGPTPADKSWDRPLVGSGTDDPTRHSLAALQWQGTEELRSVTVPGRPVTINGTGGPGPAPGETIHRPPVLPAGPSPSSVVEGLSADGLVQRRRTGPRRTPPPGDRPRPEHLAEAAAALAPKAAEPPGADVVPPGDDELTTRQLPRRIRQASLAPQLRAPVEEQVDTQPLRSPEQVRTLMSALQRGTARGRLAAAGVDPDSPIPTQRRPAGPMFTPAAEAGGGAGFSEAATVSFPAVPNLPDPGSIDAPDRPGEAGRGENIGSPGNHEEQNQATRPDKDA